LSSLKERLQEWGETAQDTLRQLRRGYQKANQFARMRIWTVAALIADVILVAIVMLVVGEPRQLLEVGLQTGFPGDMVIIHNLDDDSLEEVRVVLDGRFEASVPRIAGDQTIGLELIREFRDARGGFPPPAYRPGEAVIEWEGRSEVHDVPVL